MADQKIDLNNVKTDDDPDGDVEGLDRGDEHVEGEEGDEGRERDGKGRFVAKDKEDKEDEELTDEEKEKLPKKEKKEAKAEEDEEDEEPEKEAKDEDEEEEEPEEKPTKKPKSVPYERFQEVIAQRNSLAEKLSSTEAAHKAANKADKERISEINTNLEKLYEDVEKARADGETKEAARISREISRQEREITRIENMAQARAEAFQATESAQYNMMLDTLEEKYPVMDPDSDEFDRGTVVELEALVRGYELQGVPLTQALRKATSLLFGEDAFARRTEKEAKEEKEPEKKAPEKKKTDIKKNLAASKKNGADVDTGVDKGDPKKINVRDISEEDFDAIPESKQRELRGDFFGG